MALSTTLPEILSLAGVRRENPSIMAAGIRRSDLKLRISSKVKALEKGSTELLNLKGSYLENVKQSETAPFSSRKSEEGEEERQNYHVNTGYVIRTLREEFPELFYRELSFDICRDDIVFKDPFNTFAGIENYKSIFWALRFQGRIFFRALISVWQPSENMIMVCWFVHGIPRIPWESRSRFDGTSEYKLDKYGKIYEDRVHNIALNGPQKSHCPSFGAVDSFHWLSLNPKAYLFRVVILSDEKCCAIAEGFGDQAFLYLGSYQFVEIQDRKIGEEHEACM